MNSICEKIAALLVVGAALTAPAMTGCYAADDAYVVTEPLPPPRGEVVVYHPGYVWIRGHWKYTGGHWLWRPGHYERTRPNEVYVEGHWEARGRGHVWVEGGWRPRQGAVVREYP